MTLLHPSRPQSGKARVVLEKTRTSLKRKRSPVNRVHQRARAVEAVEHVTTWVTECHLRKRSSLQNSMATAYLPNIPTFILNINLSTIRHHRLLAREWADRPDFLICPQCHKTLITSPPCCRKCTSHHRWSTRCHLNHNSSRSSHNIISRCTPNKTLMI